MKEGVGTVEDGEHEGVDVLAMTACMTGLYKNRDHQLLSHSHHTEGLVAKGSHSTPNMRMLRRLTHSCLYVFFFGRKEESG